MLPKIGNSAPDFSLPSHLDYPHAASRHNLRAAPDFSLPSHLDRPIRLRDLRGRNVVLAFFPLAWTPV